MDSGKIENKKGLGDYQMEILQQTAKKNQEENELLQTIEENVSQSLGLSSRHLEYHQGGNHLCQDSNLSENSLRSSLPEIRQYAADRASELLKIMKLNIITRFNLKWKKIDNYNAWLSDRVLLFEKYLARSLSKQTDKDFKLVLMIDSNTSKTIIERLNNIFVENNIEGELLLCRNMSESKQKITNKYKENTTILSRIDSDDAVSENYVKNIREFFLKKENHDKILDFKTIYYFNTETKETIEVLYPRPSMFLGMLSSVTTPYANSHDKIDVATNRKVVKIDSRDVCCICHGGNISNSVDKSKKRFKYLKSDYKIETWIK